MKCKACKKRFTPTIENHYIGEKREQAAILTPVKITYLDCVDCPHCGTQHRLGIRVKKVTKDD